MEPEAGPTGGLARSADDPLLSLLLRSQSSLEAATLLGIFADELARLLDFSQLCYVDPDGEILLERGELGQCRAVYTLHTDNGLPLGELQVSRRRAFAESEHRVMEQALALVQQPLRNAFAYQTLLKQVRCDGLTGLPNRVAFRDNLSREISLAHRHDESLALLVMDLDNFKHINDVYGHRAGDRVLHHVARVLCRCARHTDLVFRYAGDEFVLIASRTDSGGARRLARRIDGALSEDPPVHDGQPLPVIASIGVASLREDETPESLFDRADANMYHAKRNRLRITVG